MYTMLVSPPAPAAAAAAPAAAAGDLLLGPGASSPLSSESDTCCLRLGMTPAAAAAVGACCWPCGLQIKRLLAQLRYAQLTNLLRDDKDYDRYPVCVNKQSVSVKSLTA
jgi:hypothetical protein